MLKINSLVVVLALFAGCGTLNPAVFGKTFYKQSFEDVEPDVITETGTIARGQSTKYNIEIKAPAGVKLDDITGMEYKWTPEEGFIAVNKSGTTDTSGQVEVINATTNAISSSVANIANIAGTLVGQKIQSDSLNQAAELANKAALQSMITEIVKQVIAQQVTPPADTPLVDLPVVTP